MHWEVSDGDCGDCMLWNRWPLEKSEAGSGRLAGVECTMHPECRCVSD